MLPPCSNGSGKPVFVLEVSKLKKFSHFLLIVELTKHRKSAKLRIPLLPKSYMEVPSEML